MEETFRRELEIDKYSLDSECLDQPRRYAKWAGEYAEATREVEKLKQQYKIAKSQAMVDIRKFPEKYGIEKATESTVVILIESHPNVIIARDLCIDAEYKEQILKTAVDSFRDRRDQLSNLIHLYLSGYWAEPKVKKEEYEKLEKTEGIEGHKKLLTKRLKKEV